MKAKQGGGRAGRELELLAIQRMGRLRPSEKLRLLDLLEAGLAFASLSLRDLEAAIGRAFRAPAPELDAGRLLARAEADERLLQSLGARFVAFADPLYPAALRELPDPPFGLYLRGAGLPAELPSIAIVGTRLPTGAGLEAAVAFASGFARAGIPVVSGLARGIDGAAHRGALSRGGVTCAVLPCGVDEAYPAANRGLASAILSAGGLLVSEYPPGTPIRKNAFPERNRIISGLARGLLVVEAPSESGALITAEFALDQGREVYVAAGRLGGPRSAGTDRLARDGARAVASADEILADWACSCDFGAGARDFSPSGDETGKRLADALRAELGSGKGLCA